MAAKMEWQWRWRETKAILSLGSAPPSELARCHAEHVVLGEADEASASFNGNGGDSDEAHMQHEKGTSCCTERNGTIGDGSGREA